MQYSSDRGLELIKPLDGDIRLSTPQINLIFQNGLIIIEVSSYIFLEHVSLAENKITSYFST